METTDLCSRCLWRFLLFGRSVFSFVLLSLFQISFCLNHKSFSSVFYVLQITMLLIPMPLCLNIERILPFQISTTNDLKFVFYLKLKTFLNNIERLLEQATVANAHITILKQYKYNILNILNLLNKWKLFLI